MQVRQRTALATGLVAADRHCSRRQTVTVLAAVCTMLSACAQHAPPSRAVVGPSNTGGASAAATVTSTPAPPSPGARPLAQSSRTAPTATPTPPSRATSSRYSAFTATVIPVTAADLPHSWHPGCPVGPAQLRALRLGYWGFDGRPHTGTLVVAASVGAAVERIFADLYAARFPIRRMLPVDAYGGSDNASTAADNTAGFNCRAAVTPGPPSWSQHAYGLAIDVNPVENPYLEGDPVLPENGRPYVDRALGRPGMATPSGVLVAAFVRHGWSWGGLWSTPDYQHFSTSGR